MTVSINYFLGLLKWEANITQNVVFCGKKVLQNTAAARLKAHRNVCKISSPTKTSTETSIKALQKDLLTTTSVVSCADTEGITVNETEPPESQNDEDNMILGGYIVDTEAVDVIIYEEQINKTVMSNAQDSKCVGQSSACDYKVPAQSSNLPTSSNSSSFPFLQERLSASETSQTNCGNQLKRKRGKTIDKFMDIVSKAEIESFNSKLATFFFGCNVPFAVIDSDHFKNFVKSLRPAYYTQLPGRKALSTTLLDQEYQRCIEISKNLMDSESVLLIDGWKNTSNNSKTIVSMLHNAKGSQAFLNAWDLTGDSESSDKLVQVVEESIVIAENLYKTKVYAVVSDNASAMLKMGRTVSIWHSSCSSHTANLLAKDVTNEELTKKVHSILKEFKHADFERALVDLGGSRIKAPCDTRWCSYRDSYMCLLENLHRMKTLIISDVRFKKIKSHVKSLIFDDSVIEEVEESIKLFDPICNLINYAQKSDSSAAEVAHLWLNLDFDKKYEHFRKNLENRKNMVLNIYVLTAYYLHPVYHHNVKMKLSLNQQKCIQDFLLEHLNTEGIKDFFAFQQKSGIFTKLREKEIVDPVVFWNMVHNHHPNLSQLALRLSKIPASSAQIERVFSKWSFVHSPLRNRLNFERSKKLLHIYYTHKMIDTNNSNEY